MKDPGGVLELNNLNVLMGMVGIFIGCELNFYTRVLIYSVKFGPSGAFNIEKFNKFVGYWEPVMFSGTMPQTTTTLNDFGPFLNHSEILMYWSGVKIPPEPPIGDFGPTVVIV
jgi:hypothetical protein